MGASRIVLAVAVFGIARAAPAESPIPGNQIDDFGVSEMTGASTTREGSTFRSGGSPIVANYVDDFGSLLPRSVTAPAQGEEPGAASGEPGRAGRTMSARDAGKTAGVAGYQHDRFVSEIWASP
jgi:hypothetical protein